MENIYKENLQERLNIIIRDELMPYLNRFSDNMNRVLSLLETASTIITTQPTTSAGQDISRAAIVFLHATVEDLLRTIELNFLPNADENVLNDIPLVVKGERFDKFKLGKLVHFRGMTIDNVIRISVEEHLQRSNYNNTKEIASILERMGFNLTDIRESFSVLDEIMERRHMIVHRADRIEKEGTKDGEVRLVELIQVSSWVREVNKFVEHLLIQVSTKRITPEFILKEYNVNITKD